ncbi:short-chain dehydrogenase reductase sdr [Colletotrichum musicola]|uniref:Short-chain dehydrogenase reductase sdr n=1 Tax=Colletotrichum musicola TaxID=2175873 RepID=A0A8H6N0T0_9PEZI|nr:short-chain dehydrogenase reductase sdr [Colletotrichum musicola]
MSKTLLVIGAGPGIGRSVAALFAKNRYRNVALIARRESQLEIEKKAVEDAVGPEGKVRTHAVDVVDAAALTKALDAADAELGKPDCVFYNAARVLPSELLTHDVAEIEHDFKINVSALYAVSQRYIPHLTSLASSDAGAAPALLVTSSRLPQEPIPQVFALSLVKAAQRNLVQSLRMTYESQGVHVGLIVVGGAVAEDHPTLNPGNIAERTWAWFKGIKESPSLEVNID